MTWPVQSPGLLAEHRIVEKLAEDFATALTADTLDRAEQVEPAVIQRPVSGEFDQSL